MVYILLFTEFFKIGLFAVGGGLATIPFLYNLATKYPWFDEAMLTNMIAISESTPGPIGVNMATYAGFHSGGILGGVTATLGLITPSIIVIIIIAHFLQKFKDSKTVAWIFSALRPAVTGLIAAAGFNVVKIAILSVDKYEFSRNFLDLINFKSTFLLVILLWAIMKYKKHPVIYIAIAAFIGIIFKF